jgi:hypothetical protein
MTTVTITLPTDARNFLEHRAQAHGLSLARLIREAIDVYARAALQHEQHEPRKVTR